MAIRIKNVGQKSLLRTIDLQFKSSAGSNTVGINVGVVPVACRLKGVFVGGSASSIALNVLTKVNNFDISNAFVVPAMSASGGCMKVLAPASPKFITAGSLIAVDLSATATIAELLGIIRFEVDKSEK